MILCLTSALTRENKTLGKTKYLPANRLSLSRMGFMQIQDIGANGNDVWVCNKKDGKPYHDGALSAMVSGKPVGKCIAIDTDTDGLPWMAMDNGSIWKLGQIKTKKAKKKSFTWSQVYKGSKKTKALDVACGSCKVCYMVRAGSKLIYKYNGSKFAATKMKAPKQPRRIDQGYGRGGDVIFAIVADWGLHKLYNSGKSKSLGIKCSDVSADITNQVYCINRNGIFLKRIQMNEFTYLNDSIGHRVSGGTRGKVWIVGDDSFSYVGMHDLFATATSGTHL
jgi:hypothetical protein